MEQAAAYRIEDAAKYLGLGKSKLYQLINAGEVEAVSIGGRRIITRRSLDAFLEKKIEEGHRNLRPPGAGRKRRAEAATV